MYLSVGQLSAYDAGSGGGRAWSMADDDAAASSAC